MKKSILRTLITAFLIVPVIAANTSAVNAASDYEPSTWASDKIEISEKAGIIPEGFDSQPFTKNITRRDFCELLINTCSIFGIELPELTESHPFSDTTDTVAEYSYMLGLSQGTAAGVFSPEMPLTREMAAVMLSRMRMLFKSYYGNNVEDTVITAETGSIVYTQPMSDEKASEILGEYSADSTLVSGWAKAFMADVYSLGILSGTGGGRLDPKSNITREQAAMLSLNVLTFFSESQIRDAGVEACVLPKPAGIFISPSYKAGEVYLSWNDIPSASAYDITICKNGEPSYTKRITDNYMDLRTNLSDSGRTSRSSAERDDTYLLYNKIFGSERQRIIASVKVTPVNDAGEPSMFFLQQEFSISPKVSVNEIITGDHDENQFSNMQEAKLNMMEITVKVWNLIQDGSKITANATLTVNKNVADDVKKIFEEIYNGKEKFPIKNCSGYAYRDGKSQHSNGTAIDINWEENYFISSGGKILAGTLWKPEANPYSIIPDGDVVHAFNRYGWHWSPNEGWPNGRDYMHFSLNGH